MSRTDMRRFPDVLCTVRHSTFGYYAASEKPNRNSGSMGFQSAGVRSCARVTNGKLTGRNHFAQRKPIVEIRVSGSVKLR
jgi:hypothetical protein